MKRVMLLLVPLLVLAFALPLLTACGGSSVLTDVPADALAQPEGGGNQLDAANLTEPEAPADLTEVEMPDAPRVSVHEGREYSFVLDVLDETYMFGGSAEDYEVVYYPYEGDYPWWTGDLFDPADFPDFNPVNPWEPTVYEPDLLAVEIWAKGAQNLKAFCCDVTFENEFLRLEYPMLPSVVDPTVSEFFIIPPIDTYTADNCYRHMQFMLNPDDKNGLNGDALLVTLMFELGNFTGHWEPEIAAPQGVENQAVAEFDAGSLTWYYYNCGDFTQDGKVDWFDVGPMAQHFEEASSDPNSICSVIAGVDKPVFITSLTPIGQNIGSTVASYNVYTGAAGDYPDVGELLGTVAFSSAQGDPTAERLSFSYSVADPPEGAAYWVKPVYDGAEGIASNLTSK